MKENRMQKMHKALVLLIAVALLIVGCGASSSLEQAESDKATGGYAPAAEEPAM